MELKSTANLHTNGVKCLVYGASGVGKTSLIATMPSPVIISAESGLLSLAGLNLPYVEVKTVKDLRDAYQWLLSDPEAQQFESVAIDSISEVAEVLLAAEMAITKDPRQAYGEMSNQIADVIRGFRDLPGRNVLMVAKMEKTQDEQGKVFFGPSMPGKKTGQSLPYYFDEVFALRMTPEGVRYLQTQPDALWTAKDRSGMLDPRGEAPFLSEIFNKVKGNRNAG